MITKIQQQQILLQIYVTKLIQFNFVLNHYLSSMLFHTRLTDSMGIKIKLIKYNTFFLINLILKFTKS